MSSELVTIDINNGIADVRLNREEKYNALSQDMFDAIIEAGQSLASADDVAAVVLSGNGRGFCAGLDMASFASMSDGSRQSQSGTASLLKKDERPENRAQRPALVWKQLPMPVIASLHGVVFGGGCQIALGADIRIAAPDMKMSIMEIKWGLVPDMSITQTGLQTILLRRRWSWQRRLQVSHRMRCAQVRRCTNKRGMPTHEQA